MLISVAGTQMQIAAILWHVNELSGEPIALGGVGLARIARCSSSPFSRGLWPTPGTAAG
jgi:hypothetical protein